MQAPSGEVEAMLASLSSRNKNISPKFFISKVRDANLMNKEICARLWTACGMFFMTRLNEKNAENLVLDIVIFIKDSFGGGEL